MGNLIRMDLYRMQKNKTFLVCLILAFVMAMAMAPLGKLLDTVAKLIVTEENTTVQETAPDTEAMLAEACKEAGVDPAELENLDPETKAQILEKVRDAEAEEAKAAAETEKKSSGFPDTAYISDMVKDPFPFLNAMIIMLSACAFFYADVENGYIKNIAGQMPKRGYTILSKFIAAAPHNLIFMVAGVLGSLLGSITVQRIETGANLAGSIGIFFLKWLLIQSICALLLLFVSTFRNKSLGTVTSVLMGMPLMTLIYSLIDQGIQKIFPDAGSIFAAYMPDVLMQESSPDPVTSILVSIGFGFLFLILAIKLFDKKDVT